MRSRLSESRHRLWKRRGSLGGTLGGPMHRLGIEPQTKRKRGACRQGDACRPGRPHDDRLTHGRTQVDRDYDPQIVVRAYRRIHHADDGQHLEHPQLNLAIPPQAPP